MSAMVIKHPLFLMLLVFCAGVTLLAFPNTSLAIGEITVKSQTLNVRSGPSLDDNIVGQISQNDKYPIIEEKDSWYKIKLSDHQDGWVASWLVDYQTTSGSIQMVEAKVNSLNVRSGPGTSFQFISQIQPEQTFPLIKEEGDWVQIKLNDSSNGWVAKWLIQISSGEAEQAYQKNQKATVQVSNLNVRTGPDTSFSILGKLSKGEEIEVLEVKGGWYKISFTNEQGWIAGDYVTDSPTTRQVKVSTASLNVRASNSLDAQILDELSQDQVVDVLNENENWLEISYDGKKGWVAKWLVTDISSQISNQPTVTIINNGTNLRKGPGTNHEVIVRANQGDTFQVIATEGEWFQILLSSGSTAYVAGWIVTTEGIPNIEREGLAKYLKGKKIVIDPGHGGKDSGATGTHFSTLEKVVNLSASNLLKSKFKATGAQVIMTRTSDRYLSLQHRVNVSIAEQADVFLSVHHNTNDNSKINGLITYFYSNGEDRVLANVVQKEVIKNTAINDLKARKGNFFVLRENPRLAILIELGFLTNYNDELTIRTNKFQENSANGILHGVAKYFKDKSER